MLDDDDCYNTRTLQALSSTPHSIGLIEVHTKVYAYIITYRDTYSHVMLSKIIHSLNVCDLYMEIDEYR
jgi:hypothetical protein